MFLKLEQMRGKVNHLFTNNKVHLKRHSIEGEICCFLPRSMISFNKEAKIVLPREDFT